jgi:hypothetical protein
MIRPSIIEQVAETARLGREAATVSTVEELCLLPSGTLITDATGKEFQSYSTKPTTNPNWIAFFDRAGTPVHPNDIELPAAAKS